MKINESPFNFPVDNYLPLSGYVQTGANNGLDAGDLDFLSLMDTLNAPVQQALQDMTEQTSTPVSKQKLKEEPSKTTESLQAQAVNAHLSVARMDRDDPVAEIKKEMDRLKSTDLTVSDRQFIQNVLLPGIPYQGSVPLEMIFQAPQDAQGGYQYQSLGISKRLAQLIENAERTGQPIRVDIDQSASLILKINQGRVSAEFLTADKTMELYLKQQLAELKTKMEEKNLPIGTLESRYQEQPSKHSKDQSQSDDNA